MKYIDADRLRKEIEWRLSYIETATGDYAEGRRCELRYLLSIIDVPRQKQPDDICKEGKVECSPIMREFLNKFIEIGDTFNFGFGPKDIHQEQPDFPTTDEQMKEFLATHPKVKVPEKYKNPDWLFKKQEQPSLPDLDEAAEEYMKKARKHLFDDSPIGRADDAFKAGAEWGLCNNLKERRESNEQH